MNASLNPNASSIRENILIYILQKIFPVALLLCAAAPLIPQPLSALDCKRLNFYPQTQFTSGGSPTAIATGDLNGDSKVDFAIPDPSDNYVSIFYNDGAGNFTGPTKITTGTYPHDLAIGDFNGDGLGDLAVLDAFNVGVEVFLNNGNGTFATPVHYLVEGNPANIITADFNRDGNLDLAVISDTTNVDVLLGTGTGTFSSPVKSTAAATGGIAVGDFDEDGVPDLAVSDYGTESLSILHGDGTGHFTLSHSYVLGGNAGEVVTGDFNRDLHLDVAVGVYNISPNNHIAVYLGSGNGNLVAGQEILVSDPAALVATDFNADGNLDLAAATFNSEQVVFALGQGTGRFRPPQKTTIRGRNPQPLDLALADFNGDGRADIVTADYGQSTAGQGTATLLLSVPCQP